jgi:hypothetical protein
VIQQLSTLELKAMIDAGDAFEFVDVRTEWERTSQILRRRVLDVVTSTR